MLEAPFSQPPWAHSESERQQKGGQKMDFFNPIGYCCHQSTHHALSLAETFRIYRAISSSRCCVIAGNFLRIAFRRVT